MIIEALLNAVKVLLKMVISVLPTLPAGAFLTNVMTFFNNTICKGLNLFCFFIRPSTVEWALTLAILIFAFHHVYGFTMWVLKKLPFLDMK